jgi:hypothetical protein
LIDIILLYNYNHCYHDSVLVYLPMTNTLTMIRASNGPLDHLWRKSQTGMKNPLGIIEVWSQPLRILVEMTGALKISGSSLLDFLFMVEKLFILKCRNKHFSVPKNAHNRIVFGNRSALLYQSIKV